VIVGVLKGSMRSEHGEFQGLVAVEPAHRLLELSNSLLELLQSRTRFRLIGREGIER